MMEKEKFEKVKQFITTFKQTIGYEPLDNAEALGMELGRILLPQ